MQCRKHCRRQKSRELARDHTKNYRQIRYSSSRSGPLDASTVKKPSIPVISLAQPSYGCCLLSIFLLHSAQIVLTTVKYNQDKSTCMFTPGFLMHW
jgi:hypothetical protein